MQRVLGSLATVVSRIPAAANAPALAPLDTYPYNSIPNGEGPLLYYNASISELSYNLTSAAPILRTSAHRLTLSSEQLLVKLHTIAGTEKSACDKCLSSVRTLQFAAWAKPVETFTELMIAYCQISGQTVKAKSCHAEYSTKPTNASLYSSDAGGLGPYYALLFANIDPVTGDDVALCHYHFGVCSEPPIPLLDESLFFTPKPEEAKTAPEPGGKTLSVLHISDTHLDPRYDIGSEAQCTNGLCCRPYAVNEEQGSSRVEPVLQASSMDFFFARDQLDFAIFTGDIVSHDNDDQLSRTYVSYLENATYNTFKAQLPSVPLYATLGNHDTLPVNLATPNMLNHRHDNIFSWNYNLLSSLWLSSSWIPKSAADYAAKHYGGYAVTTKHGLRIISINTDFWYLDNIFSFLNFTNPDPSGTLKFLADELAACETRGQRAWIIGHVLSGYTGEDALPGPAGLFHAIIARFAPRTVAAVYFGHSHMDQMSIFYDFNFDKPLAMAHVGPSVTPLTNLNAGYQVLKVDRKTFSLMDRQTYYADISTSLEGNPEWRLEYDARTTYKPALRDWADEAPLNATFFQAVVKAMETDSTLMDAYNRFETKMSKASEPCIGACAAQKRCFIRSGSSSLSRRC